MSIKNRYKKLVEAKEYVQHKIVEYINNIVKETILTINPVTIDTMNYFDVFSRVVEKETVLTLADIKTKKIPDTQIFATIKNIFLKRYAVYLKNIAKANDEVIEWFVKLRVWLKKNLITCHEHKMQQFDSALAELQKEFASKQKAHFYNHTLVTYGKYIDCPGLTKQEIKQNIDYIPWSHNQHSRNTVKQYIRTIVVPTIVNIESRDIDRPHINKLRNLHYCDKFDPAEYPYISELVDADRAPRDALMAYYLVKMMTEKYQRYDDKSITITHHDKSYADTFFDYVVKILKDFREERQFDAYFYNWQPSSNNDDFCVTISIFIDHRTQLITDDWYLFDTNYYRQRYVRPRHIILKYTKLEPPSDL